MAYRPYDSGEMAAEEPTTELASPWSRLAAWIIDGLLYFAVIVVAFFVGIAIAGVGLSDLIDFDLEFIIGALAIVVALVLLAFLSLFIVQLVLLATRGQTIGKIAMKVRIVDAKTGAHPGWARLILLRTIVNSIIISVLNVLPGAGGAYFLVDSLFIFRADHRTIHDFIAGTRVDRVG
ncbi:MAG: RDD family protein [Chloroflexi bacterium]|nr:RDD family protein [Chloroflexota bacterium]